MQTLTTTAANTKEAIHPDNYRFLQDYIYRESGIVIEHDKHYLLEARLMPVARQQQVSSVNDLCSLLRATRSVPELRRKVVEALAEDLQSLEIDVTDEDVERAL